MAKKIRKTANWRISAEERDCVTQNLRKAVHDVFNAEVKNLKLRKVDITALQKLMFVQFVERGIIRLVDDFVSVVEIVLKTRKIFTGDSS
ncbi:hypothetical protein A3I28_00695 [Candidatus Giovannonibacteria bacterium RIFCSPLOWO2_02_FULL_43_37]|uniref:Uncharacterized protein n=1 Tax=Candidatus Giovannonibacteria bacterium RIFCSPLOWO2_12_FULL_43_26 TaxID=1798363 RepID=A0A1F5XX30_9BACT|nr:MAG: hypothetical protein UW05_C0010G0027 [Candidatus Giovannonibacteria bacterium GW2011_GWC2_43_8]OGF71401.1 MAG: hypothetical protein A3E35_03220 [Candidatus Giovannonibacteria bacterium RIFCSPHIGHO2_12_FULL_44_22]OGF86364.1 MAG: hypothetical protein A3I28_00695 [Candidatus Giovannonibacteria bacterium RIFCSPLOWO2_02_FULL_43_37]OGF92464.1 MAG: hypothetical protein A3H05_03455 [Candidatus Giovannonibacteria bacterium RIFCSPLOWO2_12_FULL_43_26]